MLPSIRGPLFNHPRLRTHKVARVLDIEVGKVRTTDIPDTERLVVGYVLIRLGCQATPEATRSCLRTRSLGSACELQEHCRED